VPAKSEPTYALQIVKPFWKVLRRYPQIPAALLGGDDAAPEDVRVPVAAGQQFLEYAVNVTGEPNLGLIAARETAVGAFEALEFAAFSAPTWRAAVETAFRYTRVMNEAADFRIEIVGDKAQLKLLSTVPLTRAGIDFQSAAFHVAARRWIDWRPPELEVWITYPEPADLSEHRAVYGDAKLRFDAPWNGFVYDASRLATPLASADPSLHAVLRDHAERLLAALAPGEGVVEQVRAQVVASLKDGPLAAVDLAARMGITRRTLTRRLQREGTSFTALLDDVRRQAAQHYLDASDHSVEDIAFLLGFSESSAFVRAFKRWHGMAPTSYRRAQRGR
jgi:AraC-like DNA-binding protein